jgi:hypothetical protein
MERPSIEDVMNRHEDRILGLKGVVGIGVGQSDSGEVFLLVFVEQRDLELEKNIPRDLEGYSVEIEVIGEVKAL